LSPGPYLLDSNSDRLDIWFGDSFAREQEDQEILVIGSPHLSYAYNTPDGSKINEGLSQLSMS